MVSLRGNIRRYMFSFPFSFFWSYIFLISPKLIQFASSFSFEFDFKTCIHWLVTSNNIILKCEKVVNMFEHVNAHKPHPRPQAPKPPSLPKQKVLCSRCSEGFNECSTYYVNQSLLLLLLLVCSYLCWTEVFYLWSIKKLPYSTGDHTKPEG